MTTYLSAELDVEFVPKIKMEIVVEAELVQQVVDTVIHATRTGTAGDGKIFVLPVEDAIRIRTGESGREAV